MGDRASYTVGDEFSPNNIIAGGTYTTRKVVISTGNLLEGAVLGAILASAAATAAAGTPVSGVGGTVGNGVVSAVTTDDGAQAGTWMLECTVTGATGKFTVKRPDGTLDGILTTGSAYNGGINLTVADGANDWLVGDIIPVTVTYDWDELEYKLSTAAATDGSQIPVFVLAQDADASGGDVEAMAYETGNLVGTALTLGAGHTIASIRDGLREKGIVIH